MKRQALLVLLAIALSIVVPPSLPFLSGHNSLASIGTLDVCHSATPALSSNGNMPCVNVPTSAIPHPLALLEIPQIVNPPCKPCFIAFQDDRPPKSLL